MRLSKKTFKMKIHNTRKLPNSKTNRILLCPRGHKNSKGIKMIKKNRECGGDCWWYCLKSLINYQYMVYLKGFKTKKAINYVMIFYIT